MHVNLRLNVDWASVMRNGMKIRNCTS